MMRRVTATACWLVALAMGGLLVLVSGCATTAERLAQLDVRAGPAVEEELVTLETRPFVSQLVTLKTRPRASQRFLLIKPGNPVASAILFAGGHGDLNLTHQSGQLDIVWGKNNFLVRTRKDFAKHGFVVAVVDTPSDHKGLGMLYGFRSSAKHVKDIEEVIAYLKKSTGLPVWLIGTSRGTESAAYIAIHSREDIGGVVLTSSMTVLNEKGEAVNHMALDQIRMPTLVVAHKDDACHVTPPWGAEWIAKRLVNSPKVTVKYFRGGDSPRSRPCGALSAHGFLGIESEVVAAIADFIKSNLQ